MGLSVPLFEASVKQAVKPHSGSISARSSIQSSVLDLGVRPLTASDGSTVTSMKMLKVVWMSEGCTPKEARLVAGQRPAPSQKRRVLPVALAARIFVSVRGGSRGAYQEPSC